MNICVIIGKVVSDIKFNFVCNKKTISAASCNIELSNKSIIKVLGYNAVADFLYSKIEINDVIVIDGVFCGKEIEILKVKKIKTAKI